MEKQVERRKINSQMFMAAGVLLLIVCIVISFCIGRYTVSIKDLIGAIISKIINIEKYWSSQTEVVLFNIRFPRIMMAVLVGGSLAVAGACYQGIFQNPMASPDILGASSGAGFGAALAILLGLKGQVLTAVAFSFSLFTIVLVLLISSKSREKQIITIILAGIMLSNLFSAGTSFIKLVADPTNKLPEITYWLMGGLSGVQNKDFMFIIPPLILGLVPIFMLRWRLNMLTLNEDEAKSIGINISLIRKIIIVSATLITAACVSVSGLIGWIGLIIPNVCRIIIGNDYRKLIPVSMISGGIFLLIIDNISRTLMQTEIPLSILMAFVGTPFFIYLIVKRGDN